MGEHPISQHFYCWFILKDSSGHFQHLVLFSKVKEN